MTGLHYRDWTGSSGTSKDQWFCDGSLCNVVRAYRNFVIPSRWVNHANYGATDLTSGKILWVGKGVSISYWIQISLSIIPTGPPFSISFWCYVKWRTHLPHIGWMMPRLSMWANSHFATANFSGVSLHTWGQTGYPHVGIRWKMQWAG